VHAGITGSLRARRWHYALEQGPEGTQSRTTAEHEAPLELPYRGSQSFGAPEITGTVVLRLTTNAELIAMTDARTAIPLSAAQATEVRARMKARLIRTRMRLDAV
jgi:hypothetical protein